MTEKQKAYHRTYYQRNKHKWKRGVGMTKEERKAYNKAYYQANKNKYLTYSQKYRTECPDKVRESERRYRKAQRDEKIILEALHAAGALDKVEGAREKWEKWQIRKEAQRERWRRYYWNNRQKRIERSMAWQKRHPARMLGYRMAGLSRYKRVEISSEINNKLGIRDENALTPLEILIMKEEALAA